MGSGKRCQRYDEGKTRLDIKDEPSGLARVNQLLPLRLGQAVSDFSGEMGRSDQFMDALLMFIAQPQGCRR
jgi:hypothetical protein